MNDWLIAATALLFALGLCGLAVFRGNPMERLLGLELGATVQVLVLLLLAQGFAQPSFFDLALSSAFLTLGGGLVFARFLERWL